MGRPNARRVLVLLPCEQRPFDLPSRVWSYLSVYLFQGEIKHIDLDTFKSFEVMNYKRMYTQRRDFESHSTQIQVVRISD